MGKESEHLKLDVTDQTGVLQGIAFSKGDLASALLQGKYADICYNLQMHTYNKLTSIQMMVQDIKIN